LDRMTPYTKHLSHVQLLINNCCIAARSPD
jgi:hypothetical protein